MTGLLKLGLNPADGAAVRLREAAAGMPAGSEGVLIGRWANSDEWLVSFWDGGPLRVDSQLLDKSAAASPRAEPIGVERVRFAE